MNCKNGKNCKNGENGDREKRSARVGNEQIKELLTGCRLFEGLPPEAAEEFMRRERVVTSDYQKGDRISFSPGSADSACSTGSSGSAGSAVSSGALGILVSGKLKVGGAGNACKAVIQEMAPGALFGFATLYDKTGRFDYDVWAGSRVTVLWLCEEALGRLFESEPRAAVNVIAVQAEKIRFLNRRIRSFAAPDASAKLRSYLKTLDREADGTLRLKLGMAPLAKRLGMSRASLYRAFDRLIADGLLTRAGDGRYHLHENSNNKEE